MDNQNEVVATLVGQLFIESELKLREAARTLRALQEANKGLTEQVRQLSEENGRLKEKILSKEGRP